MNSDIVGVQLQLKTEAFNSLLHYCILSHHLPTTRHSKSPSSALKGYIAEVTTADTLCHPKPICFFKKRIKRRPLFRRNADCLPLYFQHFNPVRFDASFFLDIRQEVFPLQKRSEGDAFPLVDGLSVQEKIMDGTLLVGGYEEDVPRVFAENNIVSGFPGFDQSNRVDIPFGQEGANLMRQFKRRDRVVLETDRGNDSIDNDKHGIRRGGRGRFIIIYLTILPERRKAERRYQQNQQEDSSHGINPLIVVKIDTNHHISKTAGGGKSVRRSQ